MSPSRLPSDQALNVQASQGNPHSTAQHSTNIGKTQTKITNQVVREIILPELQKEVNEGKNFAPLRQMYSAMILSTWFKRALKESLLGKVYFDKSKLFGVNNDDPKANEAIYQQYLKAYKKGAFNYIKEEIDVNSGKQIPRKYFSGGFHKSLAMTSVPMTEANVNAAMNAAKQSDLAMVSFDFNKLNKDNAMQSINNSNKPQSSKVSWLLRNPVKRIAASLAALLLFKSSEITFRSLTLPNPPEILQASDIPQNTENIDKIIEFMNVYTPLDDAYRWGSLTYGDNIDKKAILINFNKTKEVYEKAYQFLRKIAQESNDPVILDRIITTIYSNFAKGKINRDFEDIYFLASKNSALPQATISEILSGKYGKVNSNRFTMYALSFNPKLTESQIRMLFKLGYTAGLINNPNVPLDLRNDINGKDKEVPSAWKPVTSTESLIAGIDTVQPKGKVLTPEQAKNVLDNNVGGIDFNATNLDLYIKRDGKGVPLPVAQQDWAQLQNIPGFVPVILEIKPAIGTPIMSQLEEDAVQLAGV